MATNDEEKKKKKKELVLFGGDGGWHEKDWTTSDDRVRGGKSQSYLECSEKRARFHGTLDIKTLGGAGFASQRTTGDDRTWDLSDYAGLRLDVAKGDKKRYTLNIKDELLPPDEESGRERSTVSWECDFELPPQTEPGEAGDGSVFIPWESFNATYRGRPKEDADPLDLKSIKRYSLMMRSFFGAQEGDFSLSLKSISAVSKAPSPPLASASPAGAHTATWEQTCQLEEGNGMTTTTATAGSAKDPRSPATLPPNVVPVIHRQARPALTAAGVALALLFLWITYNNSNNYITSRS